MGDLEEREPSLSPQYAVYFRHELQTMEFITLANIMAAYADGSRSDEPTGKGESASGEDRNARVAAFFDNLSFRRESESFRQLWLRLMLCSAIDNFQTYLSEMLEAVFTARPETLRSSDKVEVQEVLQYASIEEFIEASAERKVQSLTSRGFPRLRDYFTDRLGIRPVLADDALVGTTEAIALRNLFVHRRGRVTRQFLLQTSRGDVSVGDVIVLDRDAVGASCRNLQAVAEAFDEALVSHFGVQTFEVQEKTDH